MSIRDPIKEGLARGWKVLGGTHGAAPAQLNCDVAIVGSGAGAGITAELLSGAGLSIVIIEEGALKSSTDFKQLEAEAYPSLYQESANRQTADKAISILQGRCVGGSTTVNWTTSFRTPDVTLDHWRERFALPEMSAQALSPWFAQAEKRLNISLWALAPNENNDLLRRGAAKLGIASAAISRNVKDCWNLGSCGLGCPTNAKQSMLVTTLPVALDRGATLLVHTRAQRLLLDGNNSKVTAIECVPVAPNGDEVPGVRTRVVARHYVVAGGAINSPALMLRSELPDPHKRLGARTFLHPVVACASVFEQRVEGWAGAPQSIYSDHFLEAQAIDGPMGFKLEAPPMHPLITSTALPGFGPQAAEVMKAFANTHSLLALLRDGFHEQSIGGQVRLKGDGSPLLDYPISSFVWDGARRALLAMAEIQFAAGAKTVLPAHQLAERYSSWAAAKAGIQALPMKPLLTKLFTAHQMGGCGIAGKAELGVVQPDGVHWQVPNLSVHDGSLFPTSIGANPQLSIYGLCNLLATRLARRLSGREVRLA